MSTPVPFSMFVIGLIVFILYLTGYVYMIIKASNQQKEEFANDPELQEFNKTKKKANFIIIFFLLNNFCLHSSIKNHLT